MSKLPPTPSSQSPSPRPSARVSSARPTPATEGNTFLADVLEHISTDRLKSYARELRQHSPKQVAQIAASIREFGFLAPVVVTDDDTIVAGHGRWQAAKCLALPVVPAVRVGHLSPEQVRGFRLADNRLAESAVWNREALALELSELTGLNLDFDLELTGFETAEIDLIIDGPTLANSDKADECPHPVVGAVVSRLGDLWQLGPHRLFCGSSLELESYVQLLSGEQVRMVFADAPYNVPISGHVCGSGAVQHREFEMASGEMSESEFVSFLAKAIVLLRDSLLPGGLMYLAMDHRHAHELIMAARSAGLEQLNICVWNKTNGGMGSFYRSKHELIFVFKKPGDRHLNTIELGRHGRYRTNVWDYAGVNSFGRHRMEELASHPTVKPVALVVDAIKDCTRRGDGVLDAFCGSGTTLIAAEKAGRIGYGIELDPIYVDVSVRRWERLTGKVAIHEATGLTYSELARLRREEDAAATTVLQPHQEEADITAISVSASVSDRPIREAGHV